MTYASKHSQRTALMVALVMLVALAGCGKKPGSVDAPSGIAKDSFPQTYPDPKTDPLP